VFKLLSEFNPFTLAVEGMIGLVAYVMDLLGVPEQIIAKFKEISLFATGVTLMKSLWDGMASIVDQAVNFIVQKLKELKPDWISDLQAWVSGSGDIRARKSRSWRDVSVQDIVQKIASEHGLKPVISESLKAQKFAYLAQTTESDLNFLTRIAKDLDAVAKPAGGALVVAKRGENKAADGSDLPVFDVHKSQIAEGSWQINGRGKYRCVIVEWTRPS